jgi:hypothetical protein
MSWWNLIFVPCALIIALGKGRSMLIWSALSVFIGFWAVLIVALLPKKEIRLPYFLREFLMTHWIRDEMKGINSPADLK